MKTKDDLTKPAPIESARILELDRLAVSARNSSIESPAPGLDELEQSDPLIEPFDADEEFAGSPDADGLEDEALIREHAYYLWQDAGEPHGRDLEFWHQARAHLAAKPAAAQPRTGGFFSGEPISIDDRDSGLPPLFKE